MGMSDAARAAERRVRLRLLFGERETNMLPLSLLKLTAYAGKRTVVGLD
jgi:hypothetical protein